MDKLHQSQVKAYREAAVQSVKEWASSLPLQPMEEGDTKITFVNRCITSINAAAEGMPNWKLDNAKVAAMNEIRKRAFTTFEKYHPVEEDVVDKEDEKAPAITAAISEEAVTVNEAEEESEDGQMSEDGELTGDDDNVSDQEQTTTKTTHPNRKKGRPVPLKKNMALKKAQELRAATGTPRVDAAPGVEVGEVDEEPRNNAKGILPCLQRRRRKTDFENVHDILHAILGQGFSGTASISIFLLLDTFSNKKKKTIHLTRYCFV
eukprot:CAMPEP_0197262666 /NCGR_PEP_ID=MMETSP1432-20130617/623_1 /TAXON_ID=44447 /ORGANISM="Pseudo-nitzschia delicatissima, Strain UNC1205" /LENGTH=262 /DNA_ID=CAMNT_0042726979 /DNA_START=942 /DNA_END=1731 /DNA_ORIENTATION=-